MGLAVSRLTFVLSKCAWAPATILSFDLIKFLKNTTVNARTPTKSRTNAHLRNRGLDGLDGIVLIDGIDGER
jgi:hypothetical protein